MMSNKVAVVSGSNKGIGLAIVRSLCKQFDGDVYLTSRDNTRGHAAVKILEGEGLKPKYHQLDVEDENSRETIYKYMKNKYNGVDVLINNAGMMFYDLDPQPFSEKVDITLNVNYTGTQDMCKLFLPAVKPGGRIVNVSSQTAVIAMGLCSEAMRSQFCSPDLDLKKLDLLIQLYIEKAKGGCPVEYGFPDLGIAPYMVSKLGINLMTSILAKKLTDEGNPNRILINSCCPGIVDTDMTKTVKIPGFTKATPDQGADTPVYLALLPESESHFQGKYFLDRKDESKQFFNGEHPALPVYKDGSITAILNQKL